VPSSPPAKGGLFDELPRPELAPAVPAPALDFDALSSPGPSGDLELATDLGKPLELDPGPAGIELPEPVGPASSADRFGDLDLQQPSSGAIKITTPAASKPKPAGPAIAPAPVPAKAVAGASKGELKLELEGEGAATSASAAAKGPARKQVEQPAAPVKAAGNHKRIRIALAATLGLAIVGSGGYYLYQRHEKQQRAEAEVGQHVAAARQQLNGSEANHWDRAVGEARAAIELDPTNGPALGIGAEALIAGALDNGVAAPARIAQGNKMISDALQAGRTGPELDRAQAVGAVAANQSDHAIPRLQALIAKAPQDSFLQLYLGWAQLAKGDAPAAIKAFDSAVAANAAVKLSALYGRGRAKLVLTDVAGAREDFASVLASAKDHIGAQVALAATLPPSQSLQREQDLLAILARKDIATADTRAIVQAWTLAAEVARQGGRLDVARERFHKALAIAPLDIAGLTGLAAVELRDGKLEVAKDLLAKATAQAKEDPQVQLANAEVLIREGKLVDALGIVQALASRKPPLPPLAHAQLQLVKGKVLEAQGHNDEAVEAYEAGAKDAGDLDLAPTMAAVEKLSAMAKKAVDANDDKKAAEYRDHADRLLAALAARAQEDAQLSLTLGGAYLQAGDPGKAEGFLRRATEMRPTDIESKVELAKALGMLGRADDAIAQLKSAIELDKARGDVALELARQYEAGGRDEDAGHAYEGLIAAKDVAIAARVRAGRFFARRGEMEKAAEQGAKILVDEPDNAAGHYLKGEGDLKAGKLDDARRELQIATDADPDPQFFDAQGRAGEASVAANGDTKYYELALHAYERANAADPKLFNPLAGQGRVFVGRKEWGKAIPPLQAAIQLKPGDADAMYMLGLAAKNTNQKVVAIEWLKKSVAIRASADAYNDLGGLYYDQNLPHESAAAYAQATRLAGQLEKQGTKVGWLTDAYYWEGRVHMDMHDDANAVAPWLHYKDHNPPASAHTDEVTRALATTLRQYVRP
jgi:tetratricopeptide (TPR) repeat protein